MCLSCSLSLFTATHAVVSPTPTHSSSHPVICAQQLWAGPVGSTSGSNSSRPHMGLWRRPRPGTGTHLPSSPRPPPSSSKGSPPAAPGWHHPVGGSTRLPAGHRLISIGGWGLGPSPSCPHPCGSLASPGPHWRRVARPPWDSCQADVVDGQQLVP